MNNEDALLIANLFGDDPNTIPYRPRIAAATGSIASAVLLQQSTFWWKSKGYDKFYKFKQPCDHAFYKEGDSWCEELGFSRREFDAAIKRIGVKRTQHLTMEKVKELARDPDNPKPVLYWTNAGRVTYYTIDLTALVIVLRKAYSKSTDRTLAKGTNGLLQKADPVFTIPETTTETNQRSPSVFDQVSVPKEKPPPLPPPVPEKPKPQGVFEYQRVDEEPEFRCRCGLTLEIARLPPTKAVCECGAPLRVRDEKGNLLISPPQSARRRETARPGSSFAAGPVNAFCKLIGMQVSDLETRKRHQWAATIEKFANGSTAEETVAAIGAIRGSKDHGWRSFTHPAQLENILPIMLSRASSGGGDVASPPDNVVNPDGWEPPQHTQAWYEWMARRQSFTDHLVTAAQVRAMYEGAARMQKEEADEH